MVLKLGQVIALKPKYDVCNSSPQGPTFAPMESLKERRERFGITQKQMAETCGCTFSHISHIEHGRATPSLEVFVRMGEELQVSSARKLYDMLKRHHGKSASSVTVLQKERLRRKR